MMPHAQSTCPSDRALTSLSFRLRLGRALMRAIGRLVMVGKPEAAEHLCHYLDGRGQPVAIALDRLLAEDRGARSAVVAQLRAALDAGRHQGQATASQVMFATNRWRFATGGLVLRWRREGDQIMLHCRDRYHFQPDAARWSRPVHRLAAWLARHGAAAPFDMVGRASLSAEKTRRDSSRRVRYQRFYL